MANSHPASEYFPVKGVNSSCAPRILLIFCIEFSASVLLGSKGVDGVLPRVSRRSDWKVVATFATANPPNAERASQSLKWNPSFRLRKTV